MCCCLSMQINGLGLLGNASQEGWLCELASMAGDSLVTHLPEPLLAKWDLIWGRESQGDIPGTRSKCEGVSWGRVCWCCGHGFYLHALWKTVSPRISEICADWGNFVMRIYLFYVMAWFLSCFSFTLYFFFLIGNLKSTLFLHSLLFFLL